MARELRVEIVGDASSLQRAFGQASNAGSGFGSTLARVGKAAAVAIGAAGLGGLAITLRQGIAEFGEATKVTAQTNAVLKSTGGVANVTAKHVEALANEIMRYSGIDDEAVKSGQNLLLTFKQVRNEVGLGNDVFDRATKAAVDLSVAGFGPIATTAKQLGKALNDPIRGMTALGRAGVTFTQAQRDQIKALVDSNKTLEAQKLILKEVESQVGGSAKALGETLPGQLGKLRESFNNLAGDIVAKAAPAVTSFVGFLAEKGLPAFERFGTAVSDAIGPAIRGLADALKEAAPIITGVLDPLVQTVRDNLVPIFSQLQQIGTQAMERISEIVKQNGPEIRNIFENLGTVISNLAKIVVPLLEIAFTKILPVAIRILIPLLVAVTEVMAAISTVVRIAANVLTSIFVVALNAATKAAQVLHAFYDKTLEPVFAVVAEAAKVMAGAITSVVVPAFGAVRRVGEEVRDIFMWFANTGKAIWQKLSRVLPPFLAAITGPFQALADAVGKLLYLMQQVVHWVDDFMSAIGKVTGAVGRIGGAIGGGLGQVGGFFRQHGGPVRAGQPYVVGEAGPELFVPGANGAIVPNPGSMAPAAAPGGSVINLNFYGPTVGTSREFEDVVRRAIYDVQRRNPGSGLAFA